MVPFQVVAVPLAQALGLSLAVERILELGKNLLEPRLLRVGATSLPELDQARAAVAGVEQLATLDQAARAAEDRAERRLGDRAGKSAQLEAARTARTNETDATKREALLKEIATLKAELLTEEQDGEWDERVSPATILVQDATDPDDGWTLRTLVLQLLGFAAGIVFARFADVRLFTAFLAADQPMPVWVDYLLTGLLIGGGSGPVHVLLRFITERKQTIEAVAGAAEEHAATQPLPPPAAPRALAVIVPAQAPALDDWLDIPYTGGVDRDVLENIHRRDKDPSLVVYHHTAMPSQSSFEDVVGVIKSRTDSRGNHWVTGYNCVILADGSIRGFCRWDRYGSHAVGYNRKSLGITFNGNFETNPHVPFSNPDGRMGPPRPTEPQLDAGARVVTLWTFLYPIPVDFANAIIPHKQVASKACPGSGFPYDEFRRRVEFYRGQWDKSTAVQERIAAFKLKPYLYVLGRAP